MRPAARRLVEATICASSTATERYEDDREEGQARRERQRDARGDGTPHLSAEDQPEDAHRQRPDGGDGQHQHDHHDPHVAAGHPEHPQHREVTAPLADDARRGEADGGRARAGRGTRPGTAGRSSTAVRRSTSPGGLGRATEAPASGSSYRCAHVAASTPGRRSTATVLVHESLSAHTAWTPSGSALAWLR